MTVQQQRRAVAAALVPQQRAPRSSDAWSAGVVACVDSRLSPAVLQTSASWAGVHDAPVIVYVTDAATHRFASLRPTRWSGDGTAAAYDHPLDPVELYALGQQRVATAVAELIRSGLRAAGWLPNCGEMPLDRYVARRAARAVAVSADDHGSLACLLRFQARSSPSLALLRA